MHIVGSFILAENEGFIDWSYMTKSHTRRMQNQTSLVCAGHRYATGNYRWIFDPSKHRIMSVTIFTADIKAAKSCL